MLFRDNGGDSTLSIASYDPAAHDGTYVCRTMNIAGRDAGVVVLGSKVVPDKVMSCYGRKKLEGNS